MRFIYLSTTKEEVFETKESSLDSFKEYLVSENMKFHISKGKIDKQNFIIGEDIFFLRPGKLFGYYTYEIIAYCKAATTIKRTPKSDQTKYPYYFEIDRDSLRIFVRGIDIEYFQKFINDVKNGVKTVKFKGNIKDNEFNGAYSWIHFDRDDSEKIMAWFRELVFENNIEVLCNI